MMASSETASSREPEQVIMTRGGSVLGRKTILKSDHFPGCQNKRLEPQVQGAPNFRQAGSLPVYGVAIPTLEGIRRVLDIIGAGRNAGRHKHVLWHNLREEPVIYINGRPFVLREVERPFTNLEYTGIDRIRVEQMEARLKEDLLQEAGRFGSKILVCDEMPDGQMVDQWEPISSSSVQTPAEVYESLSEAYFVDYERVPITDEKSPKERDFDLLVQRVSKADIGTVFVFNCQMGRGRTTTGMVIATLVHLKRTGSAGIHRSRSFGEVLSSSHEIVEELPDSEEDFRRGEYTAIRSLCRVLEGGVEGKKQVDNVIDKCSAMQNLREAINTYRNSILRQADEKKRESSLAYFVEYLERYYFLICFAVYIHTDQSALTHPGGFQQWMKARPELYSILRRLLRRDPMGALGYKSKHGVVQKKLFRPENGRPSSMEAVVGSRNGHVLGRQTMLKSDHYPGCHHAGLPERIEGAPNFREIPGFPVYGVANPTVEGVRAVLQRVGGGKGGCPVLWHNMREEPVVYINGKPFVLREVERPFKNMLEYTGIERDRVEQMESRLKEDVLKEAEQYHGAIMVNHETEDGQIFDAWEPVTQHAVQTPAEVFSRLVSEGSSVEYARMPITDGKAPKSSDFDHLSSKIVAAPKNTIFVFNCQMGRGRTTTGTVIACLVKLRCDYGTLFKMPSSLPGSLAEGDHSSGDEAAEVHIIPTPEKLQRTQSSILVMDDIPVVRRVTRLLENGAQCREALDDVIDRCAALQNLRQAILQYRKTFNLQNLESAGRRAALNRGVEYLERYFLMIAFASYLGSEAFAAKVPFKVWLHKRPEIRQMKWAMRLRPARVFTVPEVEFRTFSESSEGDDILEAIVKSRNGSVLGKRAILKLYHFPGQAKPTALDIPGAPHMCKVDGFPIHSMATPTIQGAKAAFAYLNTAGSHAARRAVVTDLREEAVVYIQGNPFVLRELDQPVSTLKYVGIKGPAVEQMEKRLKEDILAELQRSGGRIVLHREERNPMTGKSDIIGYWEVTNPEDVQTPAEVYATLATESYNIDYKRIPLTRERAALPSDVESVQVRLNMSDKDVEYVYISHTGSGGVAYAMVITCLRLRAEDDCSASGASPSAANESVQVLVGQEDYRDVLSLVRVLPDGPSCKAEVDAIIDKCAQAGNLRDDISWYKHQLEACPAEDEEHQAYLRDMVTKALRRYLYLIAFRAFLRSRGKDDTSFTAWMNSRPELGHICVHLKL